MAANGICSIIPQLRPGRGRDNEMASYQHPAGMSNHTINLTQKLCLVCMDQFPSHGVEGCLLYECVKCAHGKVCATCLKEWFIDACKNESKMPPKCCRIIPLSSTSNLLSSAEVGIRVYLYH